MEEKQAQGQERFLVRLAKQFFKQNIFLHANALTTATLLGIVPMLVIMFSLISMLPAGKHLHALIQNFIFTNFVPAVSDTVKNSVDLFLTQSKRLPLISVFFLFVVSVLMLFNVKRVANRIWHNALDHQTVLNWVFYYVTIIVAFFFMLFALASTSYLMTIPVVAGWLAHLGIGVIVLDLVAFLLTLIAFTLIYKILPNGYVPWRFAFIGAFVATILFFVIKYLFLAYITYFPTYQVLYGAMSVIPIFILWVFISWVIILFGILLSSLLCEGKR